MLDGYPLSYIQLMHEYIEAIATGNLTKFAVKLGIHPAIIQRCDWTTLVSICATKIRDAGKTTQEDLDDYPR